jgi:hypothetical protein
MATLRKLWFTLAPASPSPVRASYYAGPREMRSVVLGIRWPCHLALSASITLAQANPGLDGEVVIETATTLLATGLWARAGDGLRRGWTIPSLR